jgi:sugar lactone lactonase YvrE
MHKIEASILHHTQCFLGEGPIWHAERKSLFWTDIEGFGFYEYDWSSGSVVFYPTKYRVSLIIQGDADELYLGVQGGLAKFNLSTKKLVWLLNLENEFPNTRCNDGACDSKGRLWIGTMDMDFKPGAGSLYCIDSNHHAIKKITETTISNGLAWSNDNKLMYFIDSPTQKVQSFFFDERSGAIAFSRDVISVPLEQGTPDGMAIDEEGMLWIAHWGGFGVYRWNPISGKIISVVSLPVPNCSSCSFVGEKLEELLITTARQDLSPEELLLYPASGDVFIARPGVRGMPTHRIIL